MQLITINIILEFVILVAAGGYRPLSVVCASPSFLLAIRVV